MDSGSGIRSSLSVSVLIHVALVAALLLVGRAVTQERDVFFVELKSITVSPPPKGEPEAPKVVKPKTKPPARIASPKKKKPEREIIKPPVSEVKTPETPEAIEPAASREIETPTVESTGAKVATAIAYSATEGEGEGDVPQGESFGQEGSGQSYGPGESRDALLARIREAIERERTYPASARRRRLEGTVVAGFSIDKGGQPHGIEVVRSSGFRVFDEEVVKIIKRAAPFPHIPERVVVPVSFKLVEGR